MAEDWKDQWAQSGYYFSDADMARAETDAGFRDAIYGAKDAYAKADAAGDDAGKAAAHSAAEAARSAYQYSGGDDGSEYNSWAKQPTYQSTPSYQAPAAAEKPSYTPQYQGYIDQILGDQLNFQDYDSPYAGTMKTTAESLIGRNYASPYAGQLRDAIGGVMNYGPYNGKYADRVDAAMARMENYGPYESEHGSQINDKLAQIADYGPYSGQYEGDMRDLANGLKNYGPYDSKYQGNIEGMLSELENYGPYESKYGTQLDQLVNTITNRDPFSYDYQQDPAWQAYKKQYTREGQRSMQDTLGQYAAMSGGVPSSAAMTAAQQAGNYYNAKMTDKIPELYQLAYSMYSDNANRDLQNLQALRGLDSDEYGRYSDTFNRKRQALGEYQNQDAVEYGRFSDDFDRMRQALGDISGLDDKDYNRYLDQYSMLHQGLGALQGEDSRQYGKYQSDRDADRQTLYDLMNLDDTEYGRYSDDFNRNIDKYNVVKNADDTQYGRWSDNFNRDVAGLNELRNLDDTGYNRHLDKYDIGRQNLNDVRALEGDNYNRYRDQVTDYKDDRNFNYNAAQDTWSRNFNERAYQDERADTQYGRDQRTQANTLYGYGDGDPYEITSDKGLKFVEGAAPGQTMTGGDGSQWTKNEDGSVTITRGGQEWTVGGAGNSTSNWMSSWTPELQPDSPRPETEYGGDFEGDISKIEKYFQRGHRGDAIYTAEGMWDSLSPEQQEQLADILKKNGVEM